MGSRVVAWLASLARRLFGEVADTAENISELGHGPYPWPEEGEFENPLAGTGPGPRRRPPSGSDHEPRHP